MSVHAFLDTRRSAKFDIASGGDIGGLFGSADRARRRAAIRIGSVAHDGDISFSDCFVQALILSFRDVNRQSLGLQSESRIADFHMTAENADIFVRIKKRVVGENLSRHRFVALRSFHSGE